jgi:hypothetical protein
MIATSYVLLANDLNDLPAGALAILTIRSVSARQTMGLSRLVAAARDA